MAEVFLVKFPSGECHWTSLIQVNIGSGAELVPTRQQAITWAMLTQIYVAIYVRIILVSPGQQEWLLTWSVREIVAITGRVFTMAHSCHPLTHRRLETRLIHITMDHITQQPLLGLLYTNGLVQDCSNSSALAMELLQSCTMRSIS